MCNVIVVGAVATSAQIKLLLGPVVGTGRVEIIERNDMYGRTSFYDHALAKRDREISNLNSRLSLAMASNNKTEVTRLTRELKRMGQSW